MKFSFVDQISVHTLVACGPDLATAVFCLAQTVLLKDTNYFPMFKNCTMAHKNWIFVQENQIWQHWTCIWLGLNSGCHLLLILCTPVHHGPPAPHCCNPPLSSPQPTTLMSFSSLEDSLTGPCRHQTLSPVDQVVFLVS